MLKSFIAQRLSHYIKDCTPDQVSARLLAGKITLTDVELNLEALSDVLVGLLPYTVHLKRVTCRRLVARVPWQAPRKNPVRIDLEGCEIEVQVYHPASDENWLVSQTQVQYECLSRRGARLGPQRLGDDEADEHDRRSQREVESRLRVGLHNVVEDGLQASLADLKITVVSMRRNVSSTRDEANPGRGGNDDLQNTDLANVAQLCVRSVKTFPCTLSGSVIDKPDEVHAVCEACVRLYRRVDVEGVSLNLADGEEGGARDWRLLLECGEPGADGIIQTVVEQKRLSGFIPNHRSRRVCPFSSEVEVNVSAGQLRLPPMLDRHLFSLCCILSDACCAPFVPIKSLPERFRSLHWETRGEGKQHCSTPNAKALIRWVLAGVVNVAGQTLERREQILERLSTIICTLNFQVLGVSLNCSIQNGGEILVEVEGLSFSRTVASTLDDFEQRCLKELGLTSEPTPKQHCATAIDNASERPVSDPRNRPVLFALSELGLHSGVLSWSSSVPGKEVNSLRLLQIRMADATVSGKSLTFRWKEVDPQCADDQSWQPVEGCIHGVQIVFDLHLWKEVARFLHGLVSPFLENFQPPPFECGWCRVYVHGLVLDMPCGAGSGIPMGGMMSASFRASVPDVIFSSVPGFGELFCSLSSIPCIAPLSMLRAKLPGLPNIEVSMPMADATVCACCRALRGGRVKVAEGFVPTATSCYPFSPLVHPHEDNSTDNEVDKVVLNYMEFVDLVRKKMAGKVMKSILGTTRPRELADQMVDDTNLVFPAKELSEPHGRSSRSSSSRSLKSRFGFASTPKGNAGTREKVVAAHARRWSELQERVRRLKCQREEVETQCSVLRSQSVSEVGALEDDMANSESEIAELIQVEWKKQMALSKKLDEQQRLLGKLLREFPVDTSR